MENISYPLKQGWLYATALLFVAATLTAPMGCSKPSETGAGEEASSKKATNTTPARGVMRSGARNGKKAAR
ncbi:MAG: hypothetical protein H7Y38_09165 [Armatimonadetes bacterium]|nr:hypothetical protein [Armatimonadota bacterium]